MPTLELIFKPRVRRGRRRGRTKLDAEMPGWQVRPSGAVKIARVAEAAEAQA